MSIDIESLQDDDVQACKDLVEWWRTGVLGESTTLRRVADEQYDGDTRRAESMLKDQLVTLVASGGIEDLIARLREAEQREQALAAHVQWRPIEEAEKYNGEYLLYGPKLVDLDFNPAGVVEGHWQDDMGWVGAVWCGQHDCWHDTIIEPTHFLPKFNPESLPETSLARLKAQWQAEAMEWASGAFIAEQGDFPFERAEVSEWLSEKAKEHRQSQEPIQ